jgi:patatin-related protein
MRQKELRLALVCYGGVSLAVYMHGVTKEIWHLARASRAFHARLPRTGGVSGVYRDLLETIETRHGLRLRVLPDVLTGASAGGINAVFLAQAIHSGQSLETLTDLWLENADVDRLMDADARPLWRFAKLWAQPAISWLLRRPGNMVSETVAPEARQEVRRKVAQFMRGRWFQPPFSGVGFAGLLHDALLAMARETADAPLLPPGHPIDLYVTATDFHGHPEKLRLNSPPVVEESEHRLPIAFRSPAPALAGEPLADPLELTLAARATASFPGAFPPARIAEIDAIAAQHGIAWPGRDAFLKRIMPQHTQAGTLDDVALIDGSVLVNKPFEGALAALHGRPAQREVDRRFVYIDPRPDRNGANSGELKRPVSFFGAILGSLSTIPREQPIRDNLRALEQQSREADRLRQMVAALRPEVDGVVERLFGLTFFLDKPTPKRLEAWRAKAQSAAVERAGFAYQSYAQAKFGGIVDQLAELVFHAAPGLDLPDPYPIAVRLRAELDRRGLATLNNPAGGGSEAVVAFFRAHDIGFRVRRLRLLTRRLSRDWETDPELDHQAIDQACDAIYAILALYDEPDRLTNLGPTFAEAAMRVMSDPGTVLDVLAERRLLPETDALAEARMADILGQMPKALRRRMLLTYLGFPFYDIATLTLMRNEGLTEFDPIKVDRISPDDALSIRAGGTRATLRGIEFYNFGAFFSRAYRENDYLWGRLHGAERMIDLVCSTVDPTLDARSCLQFKRAAFLAILEEERAIGRCQEGLLNQLRQEIEARPAD